MFDFFEFSNEMLCLADQRGYFTRVNPAWTKTLGWTAEELTSRPYIEFVHPQDLEATLREAELLRNGTHETILFRNRYRCKDGTYRWLSWQVSHARALNQLVATARDVTSEQLQAEALRLAEERFTMFMNNSPAIAWAKDEQGRFVYANKSAEDGLRKLTSGWLGKTAFEFLPREVAEQMQQNDNKVLTSGTAITVVEKSQTEEGQPSFWMNIKFPYSDNTGTKYVGGIGINITDLKNAEDALRNEQELLRDLIEVQEKEKQFLCQEFHDGLIQYAVGALMSLEGYQRNHAAAEGSAIIHSAISNIRKGIEDGRRAIRGIRPAVLDDSDLETAIIDLVDQFSASGIMVKTKCAADIGRLPKQIQTAVYRVVQEALNNAAKHSGTDVVRIELRKAGGELQFEIRDFGSGFDVEAARKKSFGLRGMTERVRLLGGECTIESELEVGTTISVRLPINSTDGQSETR